MTEECVVNPNSFPCEYEEPEDVICYRVKNRCLRCDLIWISKLKDNNLSSMRCKFCGSRKIKKLYAWKIKNKKRKWFNWKRR